MADRVGLLFSKWIVDEELPMEPFKSNIIIGVAAGITATILAPLVIPVLAMAARPAAKSLLKGGAILYEKGREALAEAGEEMEDLLAEVRAEMQASGEMETFTPSKDEAPVEGMAARGLHDVAAAPHGGNGGRT